MTSLRKLERDRALAEIASLDSLLAGLGEEDAMMRLSLEDRREELQEKAIALHEVVDHTASAALFFGGRPVFGQLGIESDFGGTAVAKFQDLVSKLLVVEGGELGQRGPVPNRSASTMHITNVVRGSFGFSLEEFQAQGTLVDTALQLAVDEASRLMAAFGDEDEEAFQTIAAEVDQRVLATTGEFFSLLKDNGATLRLVAGDRDDTFGALSVERAALRATSTTINEVTEEMPGALSGALPEGHAFEFRLANGEVIRGRVDRQIPAQQVMEWNMALLGQDADARIKVRRVSKDGEVVRQSYTLLGLEPRGTQHQLINQEI